MDFLRKRILQIIWRLLRNQRSKEVADRFRTTMPLEFRNNLLETGCVELRSLVDCSAIPEP